MIEFKDPPPEIEIRPPAAIGGTKVYAVGDPVTHFTDGQHWLRLRPYERCDKRQWLFCLETGALLEKTPSSLLERYQPPTIIDGTKTYVVGDPIVHCVDGLVWLKLRAYERGDSRRWLFCQETGSLVESEPE